MLNACILFNLFVMWVVFCFVFFLKREQYSDVGNADTTLVTLNLDSACFNGHS